VLTAVCEQKGNINFGSPNFNQHLIAKVLETGLWEPHVERLRAAYRPKRAAMLSAAEEYFSPIDGVRWVRPRGGLYVWVELPEGVDAGPNGKLFEQAIAEGVLYVPGEFCFPAEGIEPRRGTIRLSFGVQSCERIRQGIAALARAIRLTSEECEPACAHNVGFRSAKARPFAERKATNDAAIEG
jgi:2-aminoadipate transaminase